MWHGGEVDLSGGGCGKYGLNMGKHLSGAGSTVIFGTLAGAGGAALTGGNVWQGAATGAIVAGLNHVAHSTGEEDPPSKKKNYGNSVRERASNPEFWTDTLSDFLYGSDPTVVKLSFEDNAVASLLSGGAAAKGIKFLAQMAKKPNFVSSGMRKIGGFWEFSAKIAGNNGSYTIFKKYINSSGKTVRMMHDTYDKTHRFIHREIMNGQERLKIWYNGTREWFSKWK